MGKVDSHRRGRHGHVRGHRRAVREPVERWGVRFVAPTGMGLCYRLASLIRHHRLRVGDEQVGCPLRSNRRPPLPLAGPVLVRRARRQGCGGGHERRGRLPRRVRGGNEEHLDPPPRNLACLCDVAQRRGRGLGANTNFPYYYIDELMRSPLATVEIGIGTCFSALAPRRWWGGRKSKRRRSPSPNREEEENRSESPPCPPPYVEVLIHKTGRTNDEQWRLLKTFFPNSREVSDSDIWEKTVLELPSQLREGLRIRAYKEHSLRNPGLRNTAPEFHTMKTHYDILLREYLDDKQYTSWPGGLESRWNALLRVRVGGRGDGGKTVCQVMARADIASFRAPVDWEALNWGNLFSEPETRNRPFLQIQGIISSPYAKDSVRAGSLILVYLERLLSASNDACLIVNPMADNTSWISKLLRLTIDVFTEGTYSFKPLRQVFHESGRLSRPG